VGRCLSHNASHTDFQNCIPWPITQESWGRAYTDYDFWGRRSWSCQYPQIPTARKKHDWLIGKKKTIKLKSQKSSIFCKWRLVLQSIFILSVLLKTCQLMTLCKVKEDELRKDDGSENWKASCRLHGWINPNEKLNNYVKEKKQKWLDPVGNVLLEFESEANNLYSPIYLPTAKCLDFKYDKTTMQ